MEPLASVLPDATVHGLALGFPQFRVCGILRFLFQQPASVDAKMDGCRWMSVFSSCRRNHASGRLGRLARDFYKFTGALLQ